MNTQYTFHTHEFPPLYDKNSTVLILGSFPSAASRAQQFYYGHPRNRFWQIIAALTGEVFPETTAQKRDLALRSHIALWDVIDECELIGSSYSSIRNAVPTDIPRILREAPIRSIYTNGNLASKLYAKYQQELTGIAAIPLPSTSPANAAWSLERLLQRWQIIRLDLSHSEGN